VNRSIRCREIAVVGGNRTESMPELARAPRRTWSRRRARLQQVNAGGFSSQRKYVTFARDQKRPVHPTAPADTSPCGNLWCRIRTAGGTAGEFAVSTLRWIHRANIGVMTIAPHHFTAVGFPASRVAAGDHSDCGHLFSILPVSFTSRAPANCGI
jgi:hypothetical protein